MKCFRLGEQIKVLKRIKFWSNNISYTVILIIFTSIVQRIVWRGFSSVYVQMYKLDYCSVHVQK